MQILYWLVRLKGSDVASQPDEMLPGMITFVTDPYNFDEVNDHDTRYKRLLPR